MARQQVFHQPVLVDEIVTWINLRDDGAYCDCTVGGAGHLLAMLKRTRTARFIGIDCDPAAIAHSRQVTADYRKRCFFFENNFINLDLILDRLKVPTVDGLLFDLGVSYHQLTTSARGFSFDREGDLLMRMSPTSPTLSERLRGAQKEEIVRVLKEYGDVRNYKKIGYRIFEMRRTLNTTLELRNVIEDAVPRRFLKKNLHKVFQALRIWTNDELVNLGQGLLIAYRRLGKQGRMLVISYHSGEDRIVKNFFRGLKKQGQIQLLNKKVIKPNKAEIDRNPSARSAKLRVIEKCVCS
jgi:16S rRNA (cytosine1402-N4)-methyltransferase